MQKKEYIDKFRDLLNNMVADGYIKTSDQWSAHKDLELDLHKLQQSFEYELNSKENEDVGLN